MPDKPVTVRLPVDLLDMLNALGVVDRRSLAEVIRSGLGDYVTTRLNAPGFADEVRAAETRQHDQLAALARG